MAFINDESPSGTINSTNKTFTTANSISVVHTLWVDGAVYFDFTVSGTTLTLTDAPTLSIRVDYTTGETATTLSELRSLVSLSLGTQATNVFTNDKKNKALNWARKQILLKYEIDSFIVETNLVISSGKVAIPSDYLRWVRLYNSSNKRERWTRRRVNEFDNDVSNTWTIKDDSGTRKIHVYPTSTTALVLRYYQIPSDMVNDADVSGFDEQWNDAHATMAVYYLLNNDGQTERALSKKQEAEDMIERLTQNESQEVYPDQIGSYHSANGLLTERINTQDIE